MDGEDPIKHVIVLMLENRSFDHMLGGLNIEGLNGAIAGDQSRANKDRDGNTYVQETGASRVLKFDPKHELPHVLNQTKNQNRGFVDDFAGAFPASSRDDRAEIMKFHAEDALPALHFLAKNFTVCNRWHASVPGPTWANRFFVHSGTSLGRVSMPEGLMDANLHWYDQATLYDRLNEQKISWRIYYGDIPQSLMLVHQLEPHNASNYFKLNQFFTDVAQHDDKNPFPSYAFIEPSYYQPGACDDHPPHDVMEGQKLIAEVYNAIRRNDALWQSSLLVVLYDEHGGFYDHEELPDTIAPDHYLTEYTFDKLGIRVPAILISLYTDKLVCDTLFDHTSLLKYLISKWKLGPLGARSAAANSIGSCIKMAARQVTSEMAPLPDAISAPHIETDGARPKLNGGQSALVAMTQLLESMSAVEGSSLLGRLKRLVTGADGIVDVAMERVEEFLGQQKATKST